MKVICIDASVPKGFWTPLKFGSIYNVLGEYIDGDGDSCYHIIVCGMTTQCWSGVNKKELYLKRRFIPVSTIDETEFIREYNTEKH